MTTVDAPDSRSAVARPTSRLPVAELDQALVGFYGFGGYKQHSLGGEFDQNVKITGPGRTTYFVRVTRGAAGSRDVEWQNSLLLHLATIVPELPIPRLVPNRHGRLESPVVFLGQPYVVRVMTWLPGRVMAEIENHPPELLRELGTMAGRLSLGLSSMPVPEGISTHDWDMRLARTVVDRSIGLVSDPDDLADVKTIMRWFDELQPKLDSLPKSVVHQDLNDANVLALLEVGGTFRISGIVDVGDALFSVRATEVAIAAGYAMVRKSDPLAAASQVVAGFYDVLPLTSEEIAAVFPLAAARLCMNALTWTRRVADSDSAYGRKRMKNSWPAISQLARLHPDLAEAQFRFACGLPPTRRFVDVSQALAAAEVKPVSSRRMAFVDLSPASDIYDEAAWTEPGDLAPAIVRALASGSDFKVVPHLSAILINAGQRRPGTDEPHTIRLGTTLFAEVGTVISAPLAGVVEESASYAAPLVLRHEVDGQTFRTCWWGLDPESAVAGTCAAGGPIGGVALQQNDDDLAPGVQVQVILSEGLAAWPPPRRVSPSQLEVWRGLSPDPAPLLGTPVAPHHEDLRLPIDEIVAARSRLIAKSQRHYYRSPMSLVRGRDVWLYDENALGYLDSLNNVTHVGHTEPRITAAATRQMRKLNTNSRFLYQQIATYAEKLVATLPDPLSVVFFVCSGSEANDLAIRIARQVTGRQNLVNIDGAYHGNTGVVTGISPNRYKGPGGQGAPLTTHEVNIPDRYRGAYGYDDPSAGAAYAADAASVMNRISADGRPPAAFIAESLMGSAGNIVFPDGFLSGAFDAARAVGALCISDEVQVGVGRLGPWWGFELGGVVPDIVTMGKPLGNGHPIAAVVTTRAVADAFDTGMKYFNTFGGNPVSCAIGEAVLDVVESDGLRANAVEVGGYFLGSLLELQTRQPLIGDVRGQGLYLGVELVRDRETKEPARTEALTITELMKERGVIVFPNGVHDNVLKIKPPMTFRRDHVDIYVDVLDDVLSMPELHSKTEL